MDHPDLGIILFIFKQFFHKLLSSAGFKLRLSALKVRILTSVPQSEPLVILVRWEKSFSAFTLFINE